MPDSQRIAKLASFASQPKFGEDGLYPGARDEADRSRLQAIVDGLASRLARLAPGQDGKPQVLAEIEATLPELESDDTEDKERALTYVEELMEICGVDSSDGLLNEWLYGFDPGTASSPGTRGIDRMTTAELAIMQDIRALRPEGALAFLNKTFGPGLPLGSQTFWRPGGDMSQILTCTRQGGRLLISWAASDRFQVQHIVQAASGAPD